MIFKAWTFINAYKTTNNRGETLELKVGLRTIFAHTWSLFISYVCFTCILTIMPFMPLLLWGEMEGDGGEEETV